MHMARAIVMALCELGALGAFLGMVACVAAYCGA